MSTLERDTPEPDFGKTLDDLITKAAMLIVGTSKGDKKLANTLLEGASNRLFEMAGLLSAGMPK